MFLKLRSLVAKPKKEGSFTERSLSMPTLIYIEGEDPTSFIYHVVEAEEEMRPDLISEKYYGKSGNADLICKYNNIYNPFSLQKGDLLKIPSNPENYYLPIDSIDKIIDKGSIKAAPNFIPKATKDPKRTAYLAAVSAASGRNLAELQNGSNLGEAAVPPNFNRPNQNNIRTENGLIIFGGDVTGGSSLNTVTPVARTTVVENMTRSS